MRARARARFRTRSTCARSTNDRDVRTGKDRVVKEMKTYVCTRARLGTLAVAKIWTVATIGCQNQKMIEREKKDRGMRNGGRYGRSENPRIHESSDL